MLLDIDGVLYPFPEVFTPYAADQLGRAPRARHDALGVLRGVGRRLRRLRRPRHAGRRRAPAVVGGRAVRRRAGRDRPAPARPGTACTSSRPGTSPAPRRRWRRRTTGSPTHDLVVESVNLAQDKPTVLAALGLDPACCVAVDDGPHHVLAWEDAGVLGVVLDRWGTYRGDHRAARDLDGFADFVGADRRRQLVGVAAHRAGRRGAAARRGRRRGRRRRRRRR